MLEDSSFIYYLRAFLSLILIIIILFFISKFLERRKKIYLQDKNIEDIKILPLDNDTKLIILKYKNRDYLILKNKNFIKLIDKIKQED